MTIERYSGDELKRYQELQRLAYDCAEQVAAGLQPGDTERQAAARFGEALRARGVEGFFHTPFAWFGDRAGFYDHGKRRNPLTNLWFARKFFPTDRPLERGMPAILDAAPILDGRCVDMGYAFALGGNRELEAAMEFLRTIRRLILELVRQERTMRDVYRVVDASIASAGYENAHAMYPSRVLGHKIGAIPLRGGRSTTIAGFDARTYLYFTRQLLPALPRLGRTPLWNDSRLADVRPAPGLWAVEPHVRKGGIGAKWEELLVITESEAYWLDDDLPHVRARTAS
jgi:Xaa-Pro aminopeptidase